MKIASFILLLFIAVGASAQTDRDDRGWRICRYPVRLFAKGTVNLTPLFQWWTHQPSETTNAAANSDTNSPSASDRPMAAWYRIQGTPRAVTGASWLVEARVYTSPTDFTNTWVLLNRPPVEEKQAYDLLVAQIAQIDEQIVNTQNAYNASTNSAALAREDALRYRSSNTKVAGDGYRAYSALAAQQHNAAADNRKQLAELEAARKQLEAQLKATPHDNGSFLVDWFAMNVGTNKQGMAIYDLGVVSPTPP